MMGRIVAGTGAPFGGRRFAAGTLPRRGIHRYLLGAAVQPGRPPCTPAPAVAARLSRTGAVGIVGGRSYDPRTRETEEISVTTLSDRPNTALVVIDVQN